MRRIPSHAIKVKNSVDIVQAFFTHITASISSDTFKHIIGMSEKRSTADSEIVTVRKTILPFPLPRFRPWISINHLLVWSSSAVYLLQFSTYGRVNLVFYILIIFQQTGRLYRGVKDVAIDAEGLRFNFQAGQIGHSIANGSPPLRRFFVAALSRR